MSSPDESCKGKNRGGRKNDLPFHQKKYPTASCESARKRVGKQMAKNTRGSMKERRRRSWAKRDIMPNRANPCQQKRKKKRPSFLFRLYWVCQGKKG